MPLYDYECQDCGRVTEVLVRSRDSEDVSCPDCNSTNLKKLVSASVLIGNSTSEPGTTCCGRAERCEAPPCSTGDTCYRGKRR